MPIPRADEFERSVYNSLEPYFVSAARTHCPQQLSFELG